MVYYLGHYSCEQIATEKRVASPAGTSKMRYIISVISEIVENKALVVSPSETALDRYVKGSVSKISDRVSLKTFDSFHSRNKIIRCMGHMLTKAQLYFFLMTNVKADDTVIVYHSLALMKIVKKIKKLKKCRLIIEVEELYSDVKENDDLRKKEIEYLQLADKYIVITELLNKQINLSHKPRIISHGTYQNVKKCSDKFSDGKTHVVYAGSFNPIKGGASSAIQAAQYLDENFVLHILGKGTPAQIEMIKDKIEQVSKISECEIVFDGYKTGKEYDSFIQSCHIGLSTQQPDGQYNASSFPSKILMYMSNGLPVVSIRIPAVDTSDVTDYIFYYDNPDAESIAQAITSVPIGSVYDPSDRLNELHKALVHDLRTFLEM